MLDEGAARKKGNSKEYEESYEKMEIINCPCGCGKQEYKETLINTAKALRFIWGEERYAKALQEIVSQNGIVKP